MLCATVSQAFMMHTDCNSLCFSNTNTHENITYGWRLRPCHCDVVTLIKMTNIILCKFYLYGYCQLRAARWYYILYCRSCTLALTIENDIWEMANGATMPQATAQATTTTTTPRRHKRRLDGIEENTKLSNVRGLPSRVDRAEVMARDLVERSVSAFGCGGKYKMMCSGV